MNVSSVEPRSSSKYRTSALRSPAFFVLFFLYLWLYIDPRFLYSAGGVITNFPVFFKGWTFFQDFPGHPGGLLEYLTAMLSQFFYLGWAGALVVTVQAWLISLCVGYIYRATGLINLRWLRFAPPIILLIAYTRYANHFVTTTAFLAALSFTCLYIRAASSKISNRIRSIVFLVLSAVLYYIAGAAYLFFALLCAMYELLFARRPLPGLLCLLSAGGIPYIEGVLIFGLSAELAFSNLMPFSWDILLYEERRRLITTVYAIYLLLPSTMAMSVLWKTVLSPRINLRLPLKRKKSKAKAGSRILRPAIETFVLFAVASAAVFLSYDAKRRTSSAVHYYACNRMWPEVLRVARRNPESSIIINAVNRALYHTGRLGYDMFYWPQHPDVLMQTGKDQILAYWYKFDTQLDLGLINMAEKNMTECMEVFGEHPMILQRLALTNMVKGNYDSARIYLGKLSKTLFHSDWANDYLDRLQSDPDLLKDKRIQHLRSVCMKMDDTAAFFTKEKALCDLLEQNGNNKMAFEYLTTWYMLTKKLDKTIQMIGRLKDYDYQELPPLYEEALLIYAYGTNTPVNLDGYQVTRQARRRIEQFSYVFNNYKRNKQAAYGELARDYGNSYFFYHIYGVSGVGK